MFEENSDSSKFKLKLEMMKFSSPREALGAICFLAAMDKKFIGKHYTRAVNNFYASVAHGKMLAFSNPLTISGKTIDHPFIMVTWVSVNDITAALMDNGIRDCYAGEANSGDNHIITNIVSPFITLEQHPEYFEEILKKIKQITGSDKILTIDR